MTAPFDEDVLRAEFERRMVEIGKDSRVRGNVFGDDPAVPMDRESLCWRLPNGNYGVRVIQGAWVGYLFGVEYVSTVITCLREQALN